MDLNRLSQDHPGRVLVVGIALVWALGWWALGAPSPAERFAEISGAGATPTPTQTRAQRASAYQVLTGSTVLQELRQEELDDRSAAAARGRTRPDRGQCPASHPLKGNADSGIYHVPGGASYERTDPEVCFATGSDARAAGYRASLR